MCITIIYLGAQGIQVQATLGELSPEEMVGTKGKVFLQIVKDCGMVISALCGDMGYGFGDVEKNPQLIERSKRSLSETAETLKAFLDYLGSTDVAVNLDPANLVMVAADDPVQAVYTLKDYIVHTHAKEGVQLFYNNPEAVYHVTEDKENLKKSFQEIPLAQNDVDFKNYLKALDDIGYQEFLTI